MTDELAQFDELHMEIFDNSRWTHMNIHYVLDSKSTAPTFVKVR